MLSIIKFGVITISVFLLSGMGLCLVKLNIVMLNVVMLNVVMLNVVMLNVVMLNVVMLNVMAPCKGRAVFCAKAILHNQDLLQRWQRLLQKNCTEKKSGIDGYASFGRKPFGRNTLS
jgi:hypothetical protein